MPRQLDLPVMIDLTVGDDISESCAEALDDLFYTANCIVRENIERHGGTSEAFDVVEGLRQLSIVLVRVGMARVPEDLKLESFGRLFEGLTSPLGKMGIACSLDGSVIIASRVEPEIEG